MPGAWRALLVPVQLHLALMKSELIWRRPVTSLSATAERARVGVDHRILTLEEEGAELSAAEPCRRSWLVV